MKTKIILEIETPDTLGILPEEGQSEDDFKGEEKQKELKDFRENYCKELREGVVKYIQDYFDNGYFEEGFLEDMEELYIEGFDDLDKYDITISVEEEKQNEN